MWKVAAEIDYNDMRGRIYSDGGLMDAPEIGDKIFAYNPEDQTAFDAEIVSVTETSKGYWIIKVKNDPDSN